MLKKILLWVVAISMAIWTFNAYAIDAVRVNPDTFILNAHNDLWLIQNMGYYYVPTPGYEYDNATWVQSQMLKGLDYDNEFYKTRHITPDVVNWTDAYKMIEWDKPLKITSLSSIKSKLKGFLFAYRKPTGIFWMDGADFTDAFFSWYGSASNQTVIIYPIKEKAWKNKWKLLWFMEYPCWNLVCRDSTCSDLIPKPVCWDGILNKDAWEMCDPADPNSKKGCTKTCEWEKLECSVKVPTTKFDQTRDVSGINITKDSALELQAVVANGKVFKGDTLNDYKNLWKLPAGSYTINAVGINPYSKEVVKCTPWTVEIDTKLWCWDGVKNGTEQCDYATPWMETFCSRSCKLNSVSCKATINPSKFVQWDSLKQSYFNVTTAWTLLDTWYFNADKLNLSNIYNKSLDYCGLQKVTFFVKNPYSTTDAIAQCSVQLNVLKREYCWDWDVQSNEQCDPKDWKTWIACSNDCKLKTPSCEITDMLPEYTTDDNVVFWVKQSSYSKIMSVSAWDTKWSVISWTNMWSIRFSKVWTYEISVKVQNWYDSKWLTTGTCKANVKVSEKKVCQTAQ